MSFPKYPKYKDSGVEWLGEVPEHWETWKLAHAFSIIGSGTTPKSDEPRFYEDGTIPWINTGDLNDGQLTTCSKYISAVALAQHSSLKIYPRESILIAMYGATIGKLSVLEFPATVNQACCVFAGESAIVPKFMFYWFLGFRQQILSLATGGGQPNVSQDVLRTIRVACPEESEQTAIVAFLDRETSKINELVAEQRRLTELLKEKRQSVICHAVTKGLNPQAPLVKSGQIWVPECPVHWSLVPNRTLLRIRKQLVGEKHREYQLLSLTKRGVIVRDVSSGDGKHSEYMERAQEVRRGDLVFCLFDVEETPRTVGLSDHHGMISGDYTVLKCINESSAKFLEYFYIAMDDRKRLGSLYTGLRKRIHKSEFLSIKTPIPPPDELKKVVEYLDQMQDEFRSLEAEAERAIQLLQERRTALISAAVSGKIDVRGFHSKESKP